MSKPVFDSYSRLTTDKFTNLQNAQSNKELLLPPESAIEESDEDESENESLSTENSSDDEILLRNVPSPAPFSSFVNLNALTGQPGFFSATPVPSFQLEPRQSAQIKGEAPPEYKE
uniref:Uncharacterized protein n=1 Tax=Panagrolaimus davidi TaxID=227884 RepID=A0A914PAY4_9BILA